MHEKINNYCPIFDSYYDQFGQWTEKKCNSMHCHCPFCETRPEKHQHECRCIANIPYEDILKDMDDFPVSKALMKRLRKHYKNYEGLRDFITMWNEEDFIEDKLRVLIDIEESLDDIEKPKPITVANKALGVAGELHRCCGVWILKFDEIDVMVDGHSKENVIQKAEDLIITLVKTYFPDDKHDDFTVKIVNTKKNQMHILANDYVLLTAFWLIKKYEEKSKRTPKRS